jgi:hypothetical protein
MHHISLRINRIDFLALRTGKGESHRASMETRVCYSPPPSQPLSGELIKRFHHRRRLLSHGCPRPGLVGFCDPAAASALPKLVTWSPRRSGSLVARNSRGSCHSTWHESVLIPVVRLKPSATRTRSLTRRGRGNPERGATPPRAATNKQDPAQSQRIKTLGRPSHTKNSKIIPFQLKNSDLGMSI